MKRTCPPTAIVLASLGGVGRLLDDVVGGYYGENDIDKWMLPYFGATVYDVLAVYARSSAIAFIKKTPTLIVVGEDDGECPTPQSPEFHALRNLGVPIELVIYAGERHAIRNPDHQRDIILKMVG